MSLNNIRQTKLVETRLQTSLYSVYAWTDKDFRVPIGLALIGYLVSNPYLHLQLDFKFIKEEGME